VRLKPHACAGEGSRGSAIPRSLLAGSGEEIGKKEIESKAKGEAGSVRRRPSPRWPPWPPPHRLSLLLGGAVQRRKKREKEKSRKGRGLGLAGVSAVGITAGENARLAPSWRRRLDTGREREKMFRVLVRAADCLGF